jgi:hypothetical protein
MRGRNEIYLSPSFVQNLFNSRQCRIFIIFTSTLKSLSLRITALVTFLLKTWKLLSRSIVGLFFYLVVNDM